MPNKIYIEFTLPTGDNFGAYLVAVPQVGDIIVRGDDKRYRVTSIEWYPDYKDCCEPEVYLEGPLSNAWLKKV